MFSHNFVFFELTLQNYDIKTHPKNFERFKNTPKTHMKCKRLLIGRLSRL